MSHCSPSPNSYVFIIISLLTKIIHGIILYTHVLGWGNPNQLFTLHSYTSSHGVYAHTSVIW